MKVMVTTTSKPVSIILDEGKNNNDIIFAKYKNCFSIVTRFQIELLGPFSGCE